jgi:hypothetical protein
MRNNSKLTLEDGHKAYSDGDYDKAFQIFTILAEQGEAEAYGKVGGNYWDGLGLPKGKHL